MEPVADTIALSILAVAKLLPDRVHNARSVAAGLPWVASVHVVPANEVWGFGQSDPRDDGRYDVLLRAGQFRYREDFFLAHELAEIGLKKLGVVVGEYERKERLCDAIAGALLMPRPAFERALEEHGESYADLARLHQQTETAAALRCAELLERELAVVTPRKVYRRGPVVALPDEASALRRIVRERAPGVRRVRLTDATARTVVMAS